METDNSRLKAVHTLLENEEARRVRENWEAILANNELNPETQSPTFEQALYDLLITEMEDGYRRKEALQREKRKRTGRSSGYIPPQMRVSPDIGRFLFASFKWHGFKPSQTSATIEPKGLEDIAEAFGFKIDLAENKRQFMRDDERTKIIEKEEGRAYNLRVWAMIIIGFIVTFGWIIRYLMRH